MDTRERSNSSINTLYRLVHSIWLSEQVCIDIMKDAKIHYRGVYETETIYHPPKERPPHEPVESGKSLTISSDTSSDGGGSHKSSSMEDLQFDVIEGPVGGD